MDSDEGISIPRVSSPKALLVPTAEIGDLGAGITISRRHFPKSAAPGQLFLSEGRQVITRNDRDLLPPVKSYTKLDHLHNPITTMNPLSVDVSGSKVLIPDVAPTSSSPKNKGSPVLESPREGIRNKLMEIKKNCSHQDLASASPKNNVKLSGPPTRPQPPQLGGLRGASFRASSKRLTEGIPQISPSLNSKFVVTQVRSGGFPQQVQYIHACPYIHTMFLSLRHETLQVYIRLYIFFPETQCMCCMLFLFSGSCGTAKEASDQEKPMETFSYFGGDSGYGDRDPCGCLCGAYVCRIPKQRYLGRCIQ